MFRPKNDYYSPVDILSDVLDSLRPQSSALSNFQLSAPWGLDLSSASGSPMHFVAQGSCWLRVQNGELTRLHEGDLVMFPHWDPHYLLADPETPAVDIREFFRRAGVKHWIPGERAQTPFSLSVEGAGPSTRILSNVVHFERPARNPLLKELPRLIKLRAEQTRMAPLLQTIQEYIALETSCTQPGYATVSIRLSELLFIQVIRTHLLLSPADSTGWLRGLIDRHISAAISAVHRKIDGEWTVDTLAREAGLSRSAFAKRFKDVTGTTPMEHVADWRMHIAMDALITGRTQISAIAHKVGYSTPFSFGEAFKQRYGMSPSEYRKRHLSANH